MHIVTDSEPDHSATAARCFAPGSSRMMADTPLFRWLRDQFLLSPHTPDRPPLANLNSADEILAN